MESNLGIMDGVRVRLHMRDDDDPSDRPLCVGRLTMCNFCNEPKCSPDGHLHLSLLAGGKTYGFCSEGCAIAFVLKEATE